MREREIVCRGGIMRHLFFDSHDAGVLVCNTCLSLYSFGDMARAIFHKKSMAAILSLWDVPNQLVMKSISVPKQRLSPCKSGLWMSNATVVVDYSIVVHRVSLYPTRIGHVMVISLWVMKYPMYQVCKTENECVERTKASSTTTMVCTTDQTLTNWAQCLDLCRAKRMDTVAKWILSTHAE